MGTPTPTASTTTAIATTPTPPPRPTATSSSARPRPRLSPSTTTTSTAGPTATTGDTIELRTGLPRISTTTKTKNREEPLSEETLHKTKLTDNVVGPKKKSHI